MASLMRVLPGFFTIVISAAWLVPNHYRPWPAAWSDGLAAMGLLLLSLSVVVNARVSVNISWRLAGIAVLSCAVLLAQMVSGKLLFAGDALMAALYLGLWLAAVVVGGLIATEPGRSEGLNVVAGAWHFAALLSVGVALVQWTGALNLNIYGADLPPGARPFGNVGQPNNLNTLCFLGLCGLLWLQQRQKVSGAAFWLGASFLLLGMVMTQSRTGVLQIGLLLVWGLAMRSRANLRISRAQLLTLGAVFAAGVQFWPAVGEALLLSTPRSLVDQTQAGVRLPYWWSMLDAIGREPLWGYGWKQVGAAQQRVALDHPNFGVLFENGHNLVLDLLLWNGLPIGVLFVVVLAWWFIAHIRACRDARVAWFLAAVGGVFTHSMLELPLEYAYFLIPVGLAMGAIDSFSTATGSVLRLRRWTVLLGTVLLSALFLAIAVEYFKAEENYRTLRMESAHIGTDRIVTPAPGLRLLTQLEAFLEFARTEATQGMTPEQVDWMRKVSERYGFSWVMFRYALAAGLNHQPVVARDTLIRICHIYSPQSCKEAREGWATLQLRYPELADVALPKEVKN